MVKWQSPIFSELKNQLGETVVFSSWNGQNYLREYVDVLGGDEPAQQAIRDMIGGASKSWQFVNEHWDLKEWWDDRAADTDISGVNLFSREFLRHEIEVTYLEEDDQIHVEGWVPESTEWPDIMRVSKYTGSQSYEIAWEFDIPTGGGFRNVDVPNPGVHWYFLTYFDYEDDPGGMTDEGRMARMIGHYKFDSENGEAKPAVFRN